jgi:glycosyltransferase involved in cell wall biosynthesis
MSQETRRTRLTLVTESDEERLSGGFLYQRRIAEAAPNESVDLRLETLRSRPPLLGLLDGRGLQARLADSDAVLVDSLVAARVALWLKGWPGRLPLLGLVHQQPGGADGGRLRAALQKRLDLLAYHRCQALLVTSDFIAERLAQAGLSPSLMTVVPPGRDLPNNRHPVAPQEMRRGRRAAALCVSNWRRNKGIHLVLEALAPLHDSLVTLHLVGDPTAEPAYTRELRALISAPELRERVVAHGPVEPGRLPEVLAGADFLVQASRHEAYGSAVAEAMSAGLPVVAFRVDNLPYLVRDRIDGILVEYGELPALSAALALLAGDSKRRLEMARHAKERSAGFPTWAQTSRRFFDAVRAAISARTATS